MGYYFKHIMLSVPMIIWIIAFMISVIGCVIEFGKRYKNQNKIKHWVFIIAFIVVVGLPLGLYSGYACVNNHAKAVGTKKLDTCYGNYHRSSNCINNYGVEGLPKYINVNHSEIDGFNKHHKQIFEYDIIYHTYNPNRGCVVLHGTYIQGGKWLRNTLPQETHVDWYDGGEVNHNRGNGTVLIGKKDNQLLINLDGDYDDDINSHSFNNGKPCRLTSGIDSDDTVGFVHGNNQDNSENDIPSLF